MSQDKIKYLWHSNSVHVNSGYAVESRDLLYRFLKNGYDFSCLGFFGVEGYPIYLHGEDLIDDRFKNLKLKVYPRMNEPYGGDALVQHAINGGFKVVFLMLDMFAVQNNYLQELVKNGIKVIPYLPIDQEPINKAILQNLGLAHKIITFSKFGQQALEKEGFASHLIVEGIDTSIFKPKDKIEFRKKFNLPQDKFIFGMVAANKENPPRKSFQQVLEAFKRFTEKHPDSAIVFHNQQVSPQMFPIQEYASYLGIADKTYYIHPYMATYGSDSKIISELINSFDVYLNPSMTEGFGLGMVESQSCGIPVIGNRCHSMPELVKEGETGFICETDTGFWRNLGGYVYPPKVDSLYEKMEESFELVKKPMTAKKCRKNVMENYDIDKLVQTQWLPFLSELETELAEETKK